MHKIVFLSSLHMETGKCNSAELYNIIENIRPEVIFEELPSDIFDAIYYYGHSPQSLEARAVKKYIATYPIKHFPVDRNDINLSELFEGYDLISERNPEYLNLFNQKLSLIKQLGYPYINSSKFSEMLEAMQNMEKTALIEINDPKLTLQYNLENELHERREIEMLKNIYNYSQQFLFEKALFICGA